MNYLNNINKAISESGIKKKYLAEKLGIEYETFRKKLNGKSEFKISEIINLTSLLKINIMEVFNKNE